MNQVKTKTGNLGRPVGRDSEKVREALLQAARKHFTAREFKAVSLRQIAATAGVNGAMVNYYFGGKQGLYMAMVDAMFASLQESLPQLSQNSAIAIEDFSRSYCKFLAENPWWPNFMVREVLFSENDTREAMIRKFSSSFAPRLMQSIQQEISAGNYRQDLNPGLALLSLMGMTIFPFLAKPMVEQMLKISIDADAAAALAAHNIQLFLAGVKNGAEEAKGRGAQS
ncbi:MAG: TetR/AcrR family transcriptional regulator [Pseudohongiella sp.]|nr:TetR/AcrR family transcriptional regulator [Pseudohongiella sp.]